MKDLSLFMMKQNRGNYVENDIYKRNFFVQKWLQR